MGTYVDGIPLKNVSYSGAGWVNGRNLLVEQFSTTTSLVAQLKEEVTGYLVDFENALDSFSIPDGIGDAIGDVVISDIAILDRLPEEPNLGDLELPDHENIFFPLMPVLKNVPEIDLSYDTPTKPTEVNPALNYNQTPYNSQMWLELFTRVHDGMVNGGTAMTADIEQAIYETHAERNRAANEKAYLGALAELKNRGIKYPQLAIRAIQMKIFAEIMRQEHQSSNEIAIAKSDLEQKNAHFMIEQATNLEKMLRDTHATLEQLDLEAQKAAAQLAINVYSEKVKAYLAEWQAVTSMLRAKVEVVNAVVAENSALIDSFKAATDGAIAKIELINKERDALVSAYEAEAMVYKAKTDAQTSWYEALTESQKAQLMKAELQIKQAVEEAKLELEGAISINALKEKTLEAMSNIAAQVLASAMNAVNTSVSHGTSAGKSLSENYSHGESLSESHSYEHDPDA